MNSESKPLNPAKSEIKPLVAVVMGSDSDLEILKPAIEILQEFHLKVHVRILSAHRTPTEMVNFAQQAKSQGLKVIIAGAGGAAHLPGMIASMTAIPVIGVPVPSKYISGIDSMYSILQMPGGVPVATVAIGGSLNAGLLAAQILGTSDQRINEQVCNYRQALHDQVIAKDQRLIELGASEYLSRKKQSKL